MTNLDTLNIVFTSVTSEQDIEGLLELIVKSTGGKTKLTRSRLKNDLFECAFEDTSSIVSGQDSSLEIDKKLFKTNTTPAKSILAKLDEKIIGYILFHYHYSPWPGLCHFIDDIFVLPQYRLKGLGKKLLNLVMERAKIEGSRNVYFNNNNENAKIMKNMIKKDIFVSRDDSKDWSVLRIEY